MTTASEASGRSLDGVLVVDKARGPTSHDVVNVARRALGTKAIGHTGTLDPMATGVLVLVVGEATKLVNSLAALSKAYEATVRLGATTLTLDAEGEVDESASIPPLTRADVESAAQGFLGEHDQQAPNVSAIKVDGKSLYKRVRSGQVVDAPFRRVWLDAIEIRDVRPEEIDLALTCGSGFYVRSLARDLARGLGTLGHLSALRRTQNGRFALADAVSFETLRAARDDEALRTEVKARLLPLREVCRSLPHLTLDQEGVRHARCGRAVPLTHMVVTPSAMAPSIVAFDEAGEPVALVELVDEHLRVLRGFRSA
ncbi:MAG: tRNA pseudouridine synthase [Myxococcaceae bacterium]|nr:tRNA pseudouridine synthase [Myxococcaceae bacterium]